MLENQCKTCKYRRRKHDKDPCFTGTYQMYYSHRCLLWKPRNRVQRMFDKFKNFIFVNEMQPCPYCGGKAEEPRPVGDWKQFYACYCSSCGTAPAYPQASLTPFGAKRVWNRKAKRK